MKGDFVWQAQKWRASLVMAPAPDTISKIAYSPCSCPCSAASPPCNSDRGGRSGERSCPPTGAGRASPQTRVYAPNPARCTPPRPSGPGRGRRAITSTGRCRCSTPTSRAGSRGRSCAQGLTGETRRPGDRPGSRRWVWGCSRGRRGTGRRSGDAGVAPRRGRTRQSPAPGRRGRAPPIKPR